MKADINIEDLPFAPGDITAGTENELQALVVGKRTTVDLPITIERSKYYSNIVRRIAVGEASTELIRELQKFLSNNGQQVWENSWVRFRKTRARENVTGCRTEIVGPGGGRYYRWFSMEEKSL